MDRTRNDELLTVKEAAALLKISTVTVRRWLKQGRLVGYRVGARSIRLRRRDVEALLEPRKTEATDTRELPPRTDEEMAQSKEAIRRIDELRERISQERGGKLMPSAVDLIHAERNKRSYRPDRSPVADETLVRRGKAIKRLHERHAEMLRARGGEPLASSVDLIREDRERD